MSMPVETIIDEEKTLAESGFYWRERDGVKVLVCRPLEEAGFVNGFSTRLGGVSDFPKDSLNLAGFDEDAAENIYENRRRFLNAFDGKFDLATAWQVHGDGVKVVRTETDVVSSEERFDSLVSDRPNTLVGVKTADCVPILIGDLTTSSFAAVHSGWKGTTATIVVKAIETMRSEYAAEPANMIAAIGPCASGENYEVGEDVIAKFRESISDHERYFRETRPGHALVDLRMANLHLMTSAGIPTELIYTAPFCTIAHTELFFSYRVEKKKLGKTGRLLSIIGRQ